MHVEVRDAYQIKKRHLSSAEILRYLITPDDEMESLILCKSTEIPLTTTDQEIYEALGSIKPYDPFKLNKLAKLFEVTEIQPVKKTILREEHVEELRKLALRN